MTRLFSFLNCCFIVSQCEVKQLFPSTFYLFVYFGLGFYRFLFWAHGFLSRPNTVKFFKLFLWKDFTETFLSWKPGLMVATEKKEQFIESQRPRLNSMLNQLLREGSWARWSTFLVLIYLYLIWAYLIYYVLKDLLGK